MLFRLKDADVQSLDISTETLSSGGCPTCAFDYDVTSLTIGIDNDVHTLDLTDFNIDYSDIMKLVLNGLNFFAQLTADEFVRFMENYIDYTYFTFGKPDIDYTDITTYRTIFNNGQLRSDVW